jgi:hypothetical protein
MSWTPGPAGDDMERLLAESGATETDRDNVRKMVEFLRHRKEQRGAVARGGPPRPVPEHMRPWLLGTDDQG